MTNEQILKKAIEKAVENGYGKPHIIDPSIEFSVYADKVETLIFSHDFAKAFWGKAWEIHLSCMVLQKDPLKYLERFLK